MPTASVALPPLAPSRPVPGRHLLLWRPVRCRAAVVVTLSDLERSSRLMRFAVPAALTYSAVFPVVQVGVIAESWGGGYGKAAWALAATAAFLPLHLRHVAHAVRGTRPPGGVWTLAAMTALVVGVTPMVGSHWLPTYHALVVSALIVLRPPWSLLGASAVVAAQAPLAQALGSLVPAAGSYYTLTAIWRAASVFVPVWLVRAVLQLQATRRALADEAVVRERVRIDAELRQTLGAALGAIVDRGELAGSLVGHDHDALGPELRDLVDGSRRALADARQLIGGYQRGSLRAEVDTAAALLTAGGLRTRVVLPDGPFPDTLDVAARSALRAATARMLRDDTARGCAITVTSQGGRVRLAVDREDVAPSSAGAVP